MSIEIPVEARNPLGWLVSRFLDEASSALDETIPYPRRRAVAEKWCTVLQRAGIIGRTDCSRARTPDGLRDLVLDMLNQTAAWISGTRRHSRW